MTLNLSTPPERLNSLLTLFPNVFQYKKVFYIGVSNRFQLGQQLKDNNCSVTVLEADSKHYEIVRKNDWLCEVIQGDILNFSFNKRYDVIYWWHGPEHVYLNELDKALTKIENNARFIVLGCPWGINKNKYLGYQEHKSHLLPNFFHNRGYKTECIRKPNVVWSHITSVKTNIKFI
jgi:hypothetical protein